MKEASGIFPITLWRANKFEQIVRLDIYLTFRVLRRYFRAQNGPKKIFYGMTIFDRKIYFSCFCSPFKVVSGPKLTLVQSNNWLKKSACFFFMSRATFRLLIEFWKFFQIHISVNLISKYIQINGWQTWFLDWTNAKRITTIACWEVVTRNTPKRMYFFPWCTASNLLKLK